MKHIIDPKKLEETLGVKVEHKSWEDCDTGEKIVEEFNFVVIFKRHEEEVLYLQYSVLSPHEIYLLSNGWIHIEHISYIVYDRENKKIMIERIGETVDLLELHANGKFNLQIGLDRSKYNPTWVHLRETLEK